MGAWEHGRVSARAHRRAAFTMVEIIMTILVVGVGLVACMRALPVLLGASAASRQTLVAGALAADLLNEIALLPFQDPDSTPAFGPELDEITGSRAMFDDIDDYCNWTECPPQLKDGTPAPNGAGYTRAVSVVSVNVLNFDQIVGTGTSDAKRITVTVSRPGMAPVALTTVRLKGANRED